MATEKDCLLALEQHEASLARRKNVVGLGIVPVDEERSWEMAVAVYVRKKAVEDALAETERIPAKLRVEKGRREIEVPTLVIEQGAVSLERL